LGSDLNQLPLALLNIPLQLTLLGLEAGIVYVSDRIPCLTTFCNGTQSEYLRAIAPLL
jgi:hypothetical protein